MLRKKLNLLNIFGEFRYHTVFGISLQSYLSGENIKNMSKLTKSKHLHIYERRKNSDHVFRCTDPDCTHWDVKDNIEGKRAECLFCGAPFILTADSLRRQKPRCENCIGKTINEIKAERGGKEVTPEVETKADALADEIARMFGIEEKKDEITTSNEG